MRRKFFSLGRAMARYVGGKGRGPGGFSGMAEF
jgi:hypothetical protein